MKTKAINVILSAVGIAAFFCMFSQNWITAISLVVMLGCALISKKTAPEMWDDNDRV